MQDGAKAHGRSGLVNRQLKQTAINRENDIRRGLKMKNYELRVFKTF